MSNGGNDFAEEKCVPLRRPSKNASSALPKELKLKFSKDEFAPAVYSRDASVHTPPVETATPVRTPELEADTPGHGQVAAVEQKSKTIETMEAPTPKETKKSKPKKNDSTAIAVFVDDEEKDESKNAVGQVVESEDEEEKKVEKAKKKEKSKREKPKVVEKERESERKIKKIKKKSDTPSSRKKVSLTMSVKKRNQKSQRKSATRKTGFLVSKNLSKRALAAAKVSPAGNDQKLLKGTDKDPNDGFLRAMYSKAKQKILTMSKNPNPGYSAVAASEDTFVAIDTVIMKPEVTAVYGSASDYPKGVLPLKTDKNHPDKLFPGGRPFWLIRDEKPPQARVIMMSLVDSCIKDGTLKLVDQQTRPETFTPYCEDYKDLKERDEEFFMDYRRILANTVYNSCSMKAYAFGTLKLDKSHMDKKKNSKRLTKINNSNICTIYTRKEQKKKQPFNKKPFHPGTKVNKQKKKKKQNSTISQHD